MNLLFTDAPKEPLARLKAIANSPTALKMPVAPLAALGDLMINAQRERLSEHTFEGIGYLLNMLSDKLLQDCFDALEVMPDPENRQAEHDSVSAQKQQIENALKRLMEP